MSHGIPCSICGWQETDHEELHSEIELVGDPSKPLKGYIKSLDECNFKGGYMRPARSKKKQ